MRKKIAIGFLALLCVGIATRLTVHLVRRPDSLAIHALYGRVREVIIAGDLAATRSMLASDYLVNHTADDTPSMFLQPSNTWVAAKDWTVRFENTRHHACGPTAWIVGQEPLPEYTNATRFAYYAPERIGIWSSGIEFEFAEVNGQWVCTGDWIQYLD